MLLEAKVSLSASFAYVGSVGIAGQFVSACTRCVVDDAGFGVGLKLVF